MTVAVWPIGLPQFPLIQGFSAGVGDGRIISKASTGVGKRRSSWPGLRAVNISINITMSQWSVLFDFWESVTNHGNDVFWIVDPMLHGLTLLDGDGDPILESEEGDPILVEAYMLAQFGTQKVPSVDEIYRRDLCRVSFTLEILP